MARFPRWRRFLRPPLPPRTLGMLLSLAWLRRWGLASAWASPKRSPMTAAGRGTPWIRGLITGAMTALGGHRPHASVPHPQFQCRSNGGDFRRRCRTGNYYVGASSLHGHAGSFGRHASGIGWRAGIRHRDPDWEFLAVLDRTPTTLQRGTISLTKWEARRAERPSTVETILPRAIKL